VTSRFEAELLLLTIKPIDREVFVASTSIGVPRTNSFGVLEALFTFPKPCPSTAT
jgi:hypothetical protein